MNIVVPTPDLFRHPSRLHPPKDSPDWDLVALLKDADGLDRVRLGDLDPSYLGWDAGQSTCTSTDG